MNLLKAFSFLQHKHLSTVYHDPIDDMNRGGRSNRRRHEDNRRPPPRPSRPSWLDAFDREVDRVRHFALAQHGRERGIPVISFSFIGEQQIREAHSGLGLGRSADLRDRVTPAVRPADADGAATDKAAKRQKKGKEAEKPESSAATATTKEKEPKKESAKPKLDKEAQVKLLNDDMDGYWKEQAEKEPVKQEQTAVPPAADKEEWEPDE